MSAPLSCSQALINTLPPITDTVWTEAFDKVLKDVLQQCRPGYVEIPTDAFHHKVSSNGLKTPPVRLHTPEREGKLKRQISPPHMLLLHPNNKSFQLLERLAPLVLDPINLVMPQPSRTSQNMSSRKSPPGV